MQMCAQALQEEPEEAELSEDNEQIAMHYRLSVKYCISKDEHGHTWHHCHFKILGSTQAALHRCS